MSNLEDEEHDFQDPITINTNIHTRKRVRSSDSSQKYVESDADLEEATLCTLCQMPWTNNGFHATVNLKCGHVFGKNCIQKFIKESISKVNCARCPVCDQIVTKSEPRRIWPNKVLHCDESDLGALKEEHKEADVILQGLIEQKRRINHEIQQIKEQLNKYQSKEMLQKQLKSQPVLPRKETLPPPVTKKQYIYQHTFSLPNEKYRVVDLIPDEDMAIISVSKSSSKTFGVRKVNLYDHSLTEFISNHSAQIKDVKHASNNMILSTGFDKTLKLTSIMTNQVIQTYQLNAPGWSCATNPLQPNMMYCGITNNTMLVFDIRNTKESIKTLVEPCTTKSMSPIHSIEVSGNNILCSNLARSYCWTENNNVYEYSPINQFVDCSYDKTDNYKNFAMTYHDQVLFTSLRNKTSTRYQVGHFESNQLIVDWSYDKRDQKQLSMPRNTVLKRDEDVYIFFSDANMVHIRDENGVFQSIKANGPVVDIKCINHQDLLAILTEEDLQIYKFA